MIPATIRTIVVAASLNLLLFSAASPAVAAGRDPFSDGSMRLSVLVGSGYAFNETYLIIGIGAGYFVAKGLELGLDFESWSGATPRIQKISPEIRYVIPLDGAIRPYVGAFYRRTMIEDHADLNSAGGRAGIYFVSSQGSYFGAGAVYEKYLSCDDAIFHSCSDTYPEIIFAIAF
jgi:hypothetical protein